MIILKQMKGMMIKLLRNFFLLGNCHIVGSSIAIQGLFKSINSTTVSFL